MIEIKKGKEPPELMLHRKTKFASYENMSSETHKAVLDSLMRDQGYICAYCMRRLPQKSGNPPVTIEHWDAQSKSSTDRTMDYRNMLAVCSGNRGSKEENLTCDAKRGNTPLKVNPLVSATLVTIQYKNDGTIYSDDPEVSRDLNETLNLNCNAFGLVDSRRKALAQMKEQLKNRYPTGDIKLACTKLLNKYQTDSTKTPYVGILMWWLAKHT